MDIQEKLRIAGYQPVVITKDTGICELFEAVVSKIKNPAGNLYFLMSVAYNFGVVAGKREERARRKRGTRS